MSLNLTIFNAVAPEFASLTAGEILIRNTCAQLAATEIDAATFGALYDESLALLTAHRMKIGKRLGVGGQLVSEKVGDLSRTYATISSSEDDLSQTSYGMQFKRLRRQILRTPVIA